MVSIPRSQHSNRTYGRLPIHRYAAGDRNLTWIFAVLQKTNNLFTHNANVRPVLLRKCQPPL